MSKVLPKVSVIIPCFNHESFIEKAIISVLEQSYTNVELIVIDDGSSDGSVNLIEKLNDKNQFIFISQKNIGLSSTLNKALLLSTGKYFTTCSSDDYLSTDKVEKQVLFLESNPKYKLCFTKATIVDEDSKCCASETIAFNKDIKQGRVFEDILTFDFHPPVSFMYERSILLEVGAYESDCFAEDYFMNLKLSKEYLFGYIPEELYFYRMELSTSLQERTRPPIKIQASDSHHQTLSAYKSEAAYPKAMINWHYRRFVYFCAFKKYKLYAFKGMLKSFPRFFEVKFIKSILILLFSWK